MATIAARISTLIKDAGNYVASTPVYLRVSGLQTIDQVVAEAVALGGLIDPLTQGQIFSVEVLLYVAPSGSWKATPVAGSSVANGAILSFNAPGTGFPWPEMLPAFPPSKLTGEKVNTGDADVLAFITHQTGSAPPYQYTDSAGGALASLRSSFLSTRRGAHTQTEGAVLVDDFSY